MIGSHDTYTYLKPTNPLLNLFTIFWRCQKLSVQEQYDLGVRVFDVRVHRNTKNHTWGTAHGIAHFKNHFVSIYSIYSAYANRFPESIIRVILEDNVEKCPEVYNIFKDEAKIAFDKYKDNVWEIGTHFPWNILWEGPHKFELKEYYCHLFNWNPDKSILYNLKNIDLSSFSIPLYAKKHNPIITQEMIDDPNVVHIMDYVGYYPK